MSNNENEIKNKTNITKNDIEYHTKKWLDDIKDEIERNTPKVEYKLIPEIKESDRLRLLEHYTRLRFQSSTWDRDQVWTIKNLQRQLSEEMNILNSTSALDFILTLLEQGAYKINIINVWLIYYYFIPSSSWSSS